jgi:SAM-dependent methyltransferase
MNNLNLPDSSAISRYLKGFDFFERYVRGQWEGDLYVETHARRFHETLRFLPVLKPDATVLELGAIPYYLTILLKKFAGLDVDILSFFEVEQASHRIHHLENKETHERYDFSYSPLNVERDVFPFADQSYDLVLCCELLEHLLINPSHMLYEIHRVLKPDGYLLLTTPNVLRWQNVFSLLKGINIYDRYHGNGIYGRHNREYSVGDLVDLLRANAFDVERVDTRNVYGRELLNRVGLFPDRRDNIFILARAVETPRKPFPPDLYVLMDQYRNVIRSEIVMGRNEEGHLGRGWFEFEGVAPGFRWTSREAEFYLKNTRAKKFVIRAMSHHPRIAFTPLRITLHINDQQIGTAQIADHSWHDCSFDLTTTNDEDLLVCKLSVSETWSPSESGSKDERDLGVAVSRIGLE